MKKNFQFVDFPIPPRRNHFRLIIISEIIIVVSYGLMGGRRRGIYSLRMDSGLMGNAWYQGTQKIFIICPVRAVSRNCGRPSFPSLKILKEKTRIYYFYGTPILLRDGIMEIYVSGNCKFALLATIIDERIFFLYFVWKHYFSFHLSLSFSEKKKDGF